MILYFISTPHTSHTLHSFLFFFTIHMLLLFTHFLAVTGVNMTTELLQIEPDELRFVCKCFLLTILLHTFLYFSFFFLIFFSTTHATMIFFALLFFYPAAVELKKQSSCLVQLGNKADQYIAFKVRLRIPLLFSMESNQLWQGLFLSFPPFFSSSFFEWKKQCLFCFCSTGR